MYKLLKLFLFLLPPETAHHVTLISLNIAYKLGLLRLFPKPLASQPQSLLGLTFPNRIGLAAGLDKNGDYIDALATLGFGFIEIGTITPKPQSGNPLPRLFRLVKEQALINRMGFNSKGIEYALKNLKKIKYTGILGINIGKNKDTPIEQAADDYLQSMRELWPYASYFTINISSPNTPELRNLQHRALLNPLLATLKNEQDTIFKTYKKFIPLIVKIAPDLTHYELQEIATLCLEHRIDGIIATNTTLSRHGVESSHYAHETGGLSGKPLQEKSTDIIKQLHTMLQNKIPVIGVGGICDKNSAQKKLEAGASLLQTYTGFIYNGPQLIQELSHL